MRLDAKQKLNLKVAMSRICRQRPQTELGMQSDTNLARHAHHFFAGNKSQAATYTHTSPQALCGDKKQLLEQPMPKRA